MGLAPVAFTLWQQFLRYDPADPLWPNRDRFVLSAGHASLLLYAILHLAGVRRIEAGRITDQPAVSLDDIKNFRQLDSVTPGHPEYGHTTGVETTTGPLGQGCGNSVGMAIASRWLGARYNRPHLTLFDHDVYAICSDGDMMEGVASEAASLAGHLGLANLCWIYDNNTVTIEGHTDLAFSEDVERRFEGYHWNIVRVHDANDTAALVRALDVFRGTKDRPTLIIVNSIIGYGAPHKQNTAAAHSDPLGEEEVRLTKQFYGWPQDAQFLVPDGVHERLREGIGQRGEALRSAWQKTFATYKTKYPEAARDIDANPVARIACTAGMRTCRNFRPTKRASPRAKRPAKCSTRLPSAYRGSSAALPISRHRPRPSSNSKARARSNRESQADAPCISAFANTPWAPSSMVLCCRACVHSARRFSSSATTCGRPSGSRR